MGINNKNAKSFEEMMEEEVTTTKEVATVNKAASDEAKKDGDK